jgi:hypothetical protein
MPIEDYNTSAALNTTLGTIPVGPGMAREKVNDAFQQLMADIAQLPESGGSSAIGFLQAGAGAVARTGQAKLRDMLSVKDFGATGDGATNDTTAVQAAITAAATTGKIVYFPAGTYKVTTLTLPQQGGGIELMGESYCGVNDLTNAVYRGAVILSTEAAGNVISCDGGVSYNNRGVRISNLAFRVSTSGYAIYLKRAPEASALRDISIYNVNATGGSAIGLEDCWSGLGLMNVHTKALAKGSGKYGLYIFNTQKAGSYFTQNCGFNGFDYGIKLGAFTYAIKLITTNGESCNYGLWADSGTSFEADNCHFEFNTFDGIRLGSTQNVSINKCSFYNNATDATAKGDIHVAAAGPSFNNNISITDCEDFGLTASKRFLYVEFSPYASGIVRNCSVTTVLGGSTTGLDIEGTALENWTVEDNSFGSCATPYTNTAGYKSFSTAFAGYTGIRFAPTHVASSNVNTLDDYEEGTWTPVLGGDGGAPTGQTYSTQQGHYQKIGNRVYFSFYVVLTAEGTITGQAAILGLPFTISGTTGTGEGSISEFQNLGLSVTQLSIRPDHGSDKFYFQHLTAAAASTALVAGSTLATNTTALRGGGWYVTA